MASVPCPDPGWQQVGPVGRRGLAPLPAGADPDDHWRQEVVLCEQRLVEDRRLGLAALEAEPEATPALAGVFGDLVGLRLSYPRGQLPVSAAAMEALVAGERAELAAFLAQPGRRRTCGEGMRWARVACEHGQALVLGATAPSPPAEVAEFERQWDAYMTAPLATAPMTGDEEESLDADFVPEDVAQPWPGCSITSGELLDGWLRCTRAGVLAILKDHCYLMSIAWDEAWDDE